MRGTNTRVERIETSREKQKCKYDNEPTIYKVVVRKVLVSCSPYLLRIGEDASKRREAFPAISQ